LIINQTPGKSYPCPARKGQKMSAFIVEHSTINKIISQLVLDRDGDWIKRQIKEKGFDLDTSKGRNQFGWAMFSLNINAIGQRYNDSSPEEFSALNYSFQLTILTDKVEAYKALRCLLYQCSEGDCMEKPIFKLLEKIAYNWADDIVRDLPQYDRAYWG
jgi:hypothetical protein